MARKFPLNDEVMGFSIVHQISREEGGRTGALIGQYYTLYPETSDVVMRGRFFKVSKTQLGRMTKLATSSDFIVEQVRGGRLVLRKELAQSVDVRTESGTRSTWLFKKEYCQKCQGTGVFRWRDRHGCPASGPCFACKHNSDGYKPGRADDGTPGKGYQTPLDVIRGKKYSERWYPLPVMDE